MANDIPEVYIRVVADTGEVQRNLTAAERAFLNFQKSTKKGRKSWGSGMTKDFAKMAGGIFAVSTAISALSSVARRMVTDVSAFQVMQVELEVATGSAILAERAFSMLQNTAKQLPGSLKDLTTGFVRLKNMGLDASEDSLISFSNTAAAMGKSLKQFVEAVADANTREFERLKEFGILARNQGDTIKFVFRGATTEVENSSKDIVKYLTDIGHTEFAGAATKQIDTLAARFSKLQDSIFNLNIAFGDGAAGALGDFLKFLTDKADSAAASKGLSEVREKLIKIKSIQVSMSRTTWQPIVIEEKTAVTGQKLVSAFSGLSARLIPAANDLITEMEGKMANMGETAKKTTQDSINLIKKGVGISQAVVDSAVAYEESLVEANALKATNTRLSIQALDINEHQAKIDTDRALALAKQNENIKVLDEHKVAMKVELLAIQARLDKHSNNEEISAKGLEVILREKKQLLDDIYSIEDDIKKIKDDANDAEDEANEKRKKERLEREKEMKKRMAFAMEVGDVEDYNSKREEMRSLSSRVKLSEGAELVTALKEKYREVADEISILQGQLAERGLGAEKIIELNDEIDGLTKNLDGVEKALDDQAKKLTEWQEAMVDLFDDIKEGIADAIIEGEGFKGLISSILKQMAKTQIVDMLGGLGGGGGKGFLGLFKKPKGAFTGGPVSSGIPRIVGEKGPEIFTPSGAGMITPNHRVGGRGGSTVVNTYNTFDIRGSEQEVQQMIASSVELSVNLAVSRNQDLKNRGSIR